MAFKDDVEKVLPGAYRPGFQALDKKDRNKVSCKDPRQLTGSVNLDEATRASHHNSNRWDYGIGMKRKAGGEEIIWVEVHDASSSKVRETTDKVDWLKRRLAQSAPGLQRITAAQDPYVWIASKGVNIAPGPYRRQLAEAGLKFPQEHLRLE